METNLGTYVDTSKVNRNLQKYIAKSKKRLQAILLRLQWNQEILSKNCKNKSNTPATLWLDDEVEPSLPASFSTNNSVVIAKDELRSLVEDPNAEIPQRFSDLQCNFSREQKLQIYEHVIQNTEKLLEPELTVPINDDTHSSMTFAEIVAIKKREKKQKRRRYRTSKPTHIEEVRNLVELQMQALDQYLNPDKVIPPRLCHRERDLLKQQNEFIGQSTDRLKSATREKDQTCIEKRERKNRSVSRRRSPGNNKHPRKLEKEHKKRGSTDREAYNRSFGSKDRKHRSRSKDISYKRRTRSRDRKYKSRTRSKERKYRSRSKERRHRSQSKERRHRSRSKYRRHKILSRSQERRPKKNRSRSKSRNEKHSRHQRDYRNRSRNPSHDKRETRRKEHHNKRGDYEDKSRNYEKITYKEGRYAQKSKRDESTTNENSNIRAAEQHTIKEKNKRCSDHSRSRIRDASVDSNLSDRMDISPTHYSKEIEPVIKKENCYDEILSVMNNGITCHFIKQEIKADPDS